MGGGGGFGAEPRGLGQKGRGWGTVLVWGHNAGLWGIPLGFGPQMQVLGHNPLVWGINPSFGAESQLLGHNPGFWDIAPGAGAKPEDLRQSPRSGT